MAVVVDFDGGLDHRFALFFGLRLQIVRNIVDVPLRAERLRHAR